MEDIQAIKQRFEIIGNNPGLNRAIDIATQVAPTDLSVLITGESGVGKEIFPRIIHAYSTRKHAQYIAVNCGAIPEGTIDSELFGHEKGAFTGAVSDRKGYFEVTDGGTAFTDPSPSIKGIGNGRIYPGRLLESTENQRPGYRSHQPQYPASGKKRKIPGGPVLSSECYSDHDPSFTRT